MKTSMYKNENMKFYKFIICFMLVCTLGMLVYSLFDFVINNNIDHSWFGYLLNCGVFGYLFKRYIIDKKDYPEVK